MLQEMQYLLGSPKGDVFKTLVSDVGDAEIEWF